MRSSDSLLESVRVTAFANQWTELQLKPVKSLYHVKLEHWDLRWIISVSYAVRWWEIPKSVVAVLKTKVVQNLMIKYKALCRITTVIVMTNNLLLNPVTQQYQRAATSKYRWKSDTKIWNICFIFLMKMTAGHFMTKILKSLIYKTSSYECFVASAGLTHCQHFLTYILNPSVLCPELRSSV